MPIGKYRNLRFSATYFVDQRGMPILDGGNRKGVRDEVDRSSSAGQALLVTLSRLENGSQ